MTKDTDVRSVRVQLRVRGNPDLDRDDGPHLARIAGHPGLFEEFYRRHVTAITRFVARRVDDPYLVADLTAEIFVAVIDSAHAYRADLGTEIGWLYGIARNVVAADRRRITRELHATGRLAGRRLLDDDDIARLEDRIDAESAGREAFRAMTGLPNDQRAVLELVAIDGMTVKDAAAALGISPGAARVRLHRARRDAKAELSNASRGNAGANSSYRHAPMEGGI
jgi:RNA polymerase sigma-70 factor (ECF subfamily)